MTKCPTNGCHAITGGKPCKRCAKVRKPHGERCHVQREYTITVNHVSPGDASAGRLLAEMIGKARGDA